MFNDVLIRCYTR